jgi:uncharacterized protein
MAESAGGSGVGLTSSVGVEKLPNRAKFSRREAFGVAIPFLSAFRAEVYSRGGGTSVAVLWVRTKNDSRGARRCEVAKEDRGFASMDRGKQKEIASKGGKAAHEKGTAHEWTSEEAREAGRKGGMASHRRKQDQTASALPAASDDLDGATVERASEQLYPDFGR